MRSGSKTIIGVASTLLLALTGSLASAQEADKPNSLTLFTTPEWAQYVEPSLAEFTQQHGIAVEVTVVPYDQMFNQLTSAILGGQTVDVMELDPAWIPELAAQGMVAPLDDVITTDTLEAYLPGSVDLMRWDEQLFGLPLVAGFPYFFYNEDMLEQIEVSAVPKTWAEVEEVSRKAMDAGLADHGIFLGLAPLEGLMVYFDVFLKLYGGDWLNEDRTEWVFNSEAGVEALTYMKHLIDTGVVPRAALETADRDSTTTFLAGRAPFHFNWSFTYGLMQDPSNSKVVESARPALVPGINEPSYTSMGGGGYAVSVTSQSTEWAAELTKFLTSGQAATNMLEGRGSDIAWAPLYEDQEIFERMPLLEVYVEQVPYGGLRPQLTWYTEFRDNMFLPDIHNALLGQQDIQEALDAAQRKAQERLQRDGL